jgi:hypothetical protein
MLTPEARQISTAVLAITDFTALTTDLDPLAWTVIEPM